MDYCTDTGRTLALRVDVASGRADAPGPAQQGRRPERRRAPSARRGQRGDPAQPSHSPYTVTGGRLLLDGADTGDGGRAAVRPAAASTTSTDRGRDPVRARSPCCTGATCWPPRWCRPASGTRRTSGAGSAPSRSRCGPGATIAAKTPAKLAEVAEAAVRLDGVRQMVMTTGTTAGPDRGAPAPRPLRARRAGGGAGPADPGADRAAGGPAVDPGTCTTRARARSGSTSSRWTTRSGAGGCRASPRCR